MTIKYFLAYYNQFLTDLKPQKQLIMFSFKLNARYSQTGQITPSLSFKSIIILFFSYSSVCHCSKLSSISLRTISCSSMSFSISFESSSRTILLIKFYKRSFGGKNFGNHKNIFKLINLLTVRSILIFLEYAKASSRFCFIRERQF